MTWRNFAGRRQPVRIIPYLYLGRRVEGRTCALYTVPFPFQDIWPSNQNIRLNHRVRPVSISDPLHRVCVGG